ncbi:MAG: glycosyltransferase family 4 protein [Pseudorhodobacter sp.]|nr:glycosyltransferase family 4 protein [Pseudorhodobacter sp.]
MKITLIETDAQGGLLHFSYQMAEALAATGAETVLLTGRNHELAHLPHRAQVAPILQFWPQFEVAEASPIRRRMRAGLRPLRRIWRGIVTVREWSRLTLWLLRNPPDVAIFSTIRFPFQVVFLSILSAAGIPMVQVCHEFERREANRTAFVGLSTRMYGAVYRQFSAILFVSETTRQDFLTAFGPVAPTYAIPHGPQLLFAPNPDAEQRLRAANGLEPGERVVLFVGGLRPSKGVPDLIDAFALLPDRADLRLLIAGYPSREFDTGAIERQVQDLGIAGQVRFRFEYVPGDEIGALVQLADVVVFPYRSATASGAVALAQTLRRPIVATAVGGLPEAIDDGVTGTLVPPGDIAALATAIGQMLADPEAARRMADSGYEMVTRTRSWEDIAHRIRLILTELEIGVRGSAAARG